MTDLERFVAAHPLATTGAALLLALVLIRAIGRALRRLRARARSSRAYAAEERAAVILARKGYRVIGKQVAARYMLRVDGAISPVDVRADYVVEANGARFVAEVKSGRLAPRLDTASTRRQLLEYRLAFDVEGVLLVDGESERVHAVEFPSRTRLSQRPLWVLAVAFGMGCAFSAVASNAWLLFIK